MKTTRKIMLGLLVVLVVIQFIRPARNQSGAATPTDITVVCNVPADVQATLQKACYDCHSNNTHYPWYNNIQPVAWWLANHVNEGKEELNFSDFGSYKLKRQARKMKEIVEQVEKDEMPLTSYTWIHKDAVLSGAEKESLIAWAKKMELELRTKMAPAP